MPLRRLLLLVALIAFSGAGALSARAAKTVTIEIVGVAFKVPEAKAEVGDTVEWVNHDIVAHTATEKNGLWDVEIAPNKKAHIVVKQAGTFAYYCQYHPNMTATLVVTAPK